jgi:predicted  nucleic acid-binding Zn-ribbon protein
MSTLLIHGRVAGDVVMVPPAVAVCPECGGRLYLDVVEWESDSGRPTDGGVHVDCEREPDPDDDSPEAEDAEHRSWQSDWMPVMDRVTAWARRHVRVRKERAG